MFWGLIMEPHRRYTQKVKKAFHISMASLDISTSSEESAQVMCGIEGRNYLLCTLRKPDVMQCPLDLNFTVGSELSFAANGKCHVHLTGYLIEDFPQEVEEEEEEETEDEIEEPVKKKKRSNKNAKNGPPLKKSKVKDSDDDDDSSEESELNVGDLLEKSFNEDDNDDSYIEEEEEGEDGEEEESEDEDEGDEDVEEEESSLDDSDVEEVNSTESPKKNNLKMNGTSSTPAKDKKKKQGTDSKLNDSKTPSKESKTPNKESKMSKKESKTPNKDSKTPSKESLTPKKKVLQGGVVVEDIKDGQGAVAKAGKFVTVYYEGRLRQNNKMFDSTTKGTGFTFRLGGGEVIKGWDVGVAGMKIGGKRKIICPPAMAYGAKGSPPTIPANSTLVFEVELKKIR